MRVFSLVLLLSTLCFQARALEVLYAHLAFRASDGSPYVETQYCILNGSLNFVKTKDKNHQAAYAIRLFFINDRNDTVRQEHYTLRTPPVNDPEKAGFDLIDIRRNALPSGEYRIGLVVKDINGTESFQSERSLKLYFPAESMTFSSPLLVKEYKQSSGNASNFERAGFEILPYPLAYFPDSAGHLTVYYEIYNTNKSTTDSTVLFRCSIRSTSNETIGQFVVDDVQPTGSFNIFFASIDISQLKSGRYFLHLAALDQDKNEIKETGFFFTRAVQTRNSYDSLSSVNVSETFAGNLNKDSLWMWLGGLEHTANAEEQRMIREIQKSNDSLQARRFIYVFMQNRRPEDPEEAWLEYRRLFEDVEYSFASPIRHGYETDRGRVYMGYGKPDQRNVSGNEPGAYPYEVWQYYRLPTGQTNVYFVFYLPGLATNEFRLIQSNARGETQDPHWKQKIYPMNNSADPDNTNVSDHFGKRIDAYIPR